MYIRFRIFRPISLRSRSFPTPSLYINFASHCTLAFFAEHSEQFSFRESGYLWLYTDPALFARARRILSLQNRYGLEVEELSAGDVAGRFALIDRNLDELVGATFSPRDGLLNPNAVRRFYRERAEASGAVFRDHDYVAGVETRVYEEMA